MNYLSSSFHNELMKTLPSVKLICRLGCILVFLFQSGSAYSQVAGCTDPAANNYNSSATVNDGSCTYNQTFYTPPIKVDPISNALTENSGLQWAGASLWSFNDGGHSATLFRIDTASDAVLQTVSLQGATNVDWEDMAFDGTHFYIGDFGNNQNGARTDLKIYKFPLSAIADYVSNPTFTVPSGDIEVISFTYSDQVQPPVPSGTNNTKFDCEAMIVDGGKIHLFTKNWVNLNTTHYIINGTTAGSYVATPLETLATNYLVTAADKVPNSNVVVLIGYQNSGTGSHFLHLLSDFHDGLYFNGNKRQIDLPSAAEMGQVEGITFRNENYGYISNEKFSRTVLGLELTVNQKLRSFNTTAFLTSQVLPVKLQRFRVKKAAGVNNVSWQFSAPVKNLKLEWSDNRTHFSVLQTHNHSGGGQYLHQPPATTACYRLSWQEDNGATRFSEVVCQENKGQTAFSNILLRHNGELSFRMNAGPEQNCLFRLITTDGKVFAQTAQRTVFPGPNKISFAKNLMPSSVLLLEIRGAEESRRLMVNVQ